MSYKEKKAAARDEIIQFCSEIFEQDLSLGELIYYQNQIEKIGRRYGLIKELKENGII